MKTINYETKGMTTYHAIILVNLIKESHSMTYPDNYEDLKNLCFKIHDFLKKNQLIETKFFVELNKKIRNFEVKTIDPNIMLENFNHIKSMPLDLHAILISEKFGIPYQMSY